MADVESKKGANNHFNVTSSPGPMKGNLKCRCNWLIPVLRLIVLVAMITATVLMALDRQTATILLAVGNTSIPVKVVAKSKYIKAYVFFVIANAVGSFFSSLVLLFEIFGKKFNVEKLGRSLILIIDMGVVALVSLATGGATFVGQISRDGNSHAQWGKVCDKVEAFCNIGMAAVIISYTAIALLIIINAINAIKNHRN